MQKSIQGLISIKSVGKSVGVSLTLFFRIV